MESPNAPPAHDFFTPAWLKLPDPQVPKKSFSSVSPSSQSGLESSSKRYNSLDRKELNSNNSTNFEPNCESRERFNTNSHDSSQPYLRHNSFGNEQQFTKPNAQTIGNNVNGFRTKKYIDSSQRPIYRNNYHQKGSIAHHSSTKANGNANSFKQNFNSSTKKAFNKSSDYGLDNESNEKNTPNEENCNVFNQEFPSLVNDGNGGPNGALNDNSCFHSAWTNNATKSKVLSTSKKFQLIHSSVANFDNIESGTKSDASIANTSKSVISAPAYRNMSLMAKGKGGMGGMMKENAIYSKIQPMLTKASVHTTSPAMEILVKNPKKRSNKSDFLNSIRNNQNKDKEFDKDCNELEAKLEKVDISGDNRNSFDGLESEMERKLCQNNQICYENDVKNSQNINNKYICRQSDDYEDMGVLSSSLEAEHRLLMELGWKAEPDDDPSYAPLTEDEVKEFKDLINARNGFRTRTQSQMPSQSQNTQNTTTPSNQTIHLNLSPKKWSTTDEFGVRNHFEEEESSSSSDDD